MLSSALKHASPVAVASTGVLTLELDEANDFFAQAITTGKTDILAALRTWFPAVTRVELRTNEQASSAPPKRLTDDMVRAERVANLRKRDPVLGAAIDALDLEVIE